ncbi:putative transport permease YvfS [Sporosarcina sp. NCCP-2222]|uniref:ABC transporter permease n=1 Tax=Sporosarcina sp. NCCP-2222 TaxID=2935073 RepID=UPI002087F000|nr:ABC transporter permease [Sporosarcina sp. NCCP-2222]GKV57188.1 putative transport permease YvfS [Sporosarcina sp. NCCP-2222]
MSMLLRECKVEVIRIFRNPYFIFWSLLMPIVFYVIFTKVVNQGMENQAEWNAYFLMSIAAFSVMGSSIMTLGIRMVQEKSEGWTILLRVTPLPASYYFIAKMVGQSAVHIFSICIIFLSGFLINGVTMPIGEWILCGGWILLGSAPFLAMGLLVGTMKKVDTASGVSNIFYLLLAITGGLWMPMEILPKLVQTIGMWLPAFHYGNGAWSIVRGDFPEVKNVLILVMYLLLFMVISVYSRRKQEVV